MNREHIESDAIDYLKQQLKKSDKVTADVKDLINYREHHGAIFYLILL